MGIFEEHWRKKRPDKNDHKKISNYSKLYTYKFTYPGNAICRPRHNNVHRIPLVHLRKRDAQYLLHPIGSPNACIDGSHLIAVDCPNMQPGGGTSSDIAGQIVHRHRGYGTCMALQLANKHASGQVPDDSRAVSRTGNDNVVGGAGCQAGDGVGVAVQVMFDGERFFSRFVFPDCYNLEVWVRMKFIKVEESMITSDFQQEKFASVRSPLQN